MGLVVIAHYSFAHEARIAQSTLNAVGIIAYVSDENLVQMNWLYSNALGGVKLQVEEQDVEAALEILATDFSDALEAEFPPDEAEALTCPQCGGHQVRYEIKGKEGAFLSTAILGVPVTPFSRGYRCRTCGNFWKIE